MAQSCSAIRTKYVVVDKKEASSSSILTGELPAVLLAGSGSSSTKNYLFLDIPNTHGSIKAELLGSLPSVGAQAARDGLAYGTCNASGAGAFNEQCAKHLACVCEHGAMPPRYFYRNPYISVHRDELGPLHRQRRQLRQVGGGGDGLPAAAPVRVPTSTTRTGSGRATTC
jgi:hypothetical protein